MKIQGMGTAVGNVRESVCRSEQDTSGCVG